MRRIVACALMLFSTTAYAATDVSPPEQRGVFEGTGRACNGHLTITKREIRWDSSFSLCRATTFDILGPVETDYGPETHYKLHKLDPKHCRYPIIAVTHRVSDDGNPAHDTWSVGGLTADGDRMDCPLYRIQ